MRFFYDSDDKILSGHDVSDGGLVTCLIEMSISGISGLDLNLQHKPNCSAVEVLFAEEVGWVLEVREKDLNDVLGVFKKHEAPVAHVVGKSVGLGMDSKVKVAVNSKVVLDSTVLALSSTWEETSYHLELRQTNTECATQEYKNFKDRSSPAYKLTFDPDVPLYEKMTGRFCDFINIWRNSEVTRVYVCSECTSSSAKRGGNERRSGDGRVSGRSWIRSLGRDYARPAEQPDNA